MIKMLDELRQAQTVSFGDGIFEFSTFIKPKLKYFDS